MKTAVWDTYVTKNDGSVMHFDIVVPETMKDEKMIYDYGKAYLQSKNLDGLALASNESQFCHIESPQPATIAAIEEKGYHIIEMEGC